ncbi:hypothetical protein Taro_032292, partial [Colocasia esculenta]|nr:hypothetical protein [Colocasia esculenta]
GGPLASLSEAVIHNLFDHPSLGYDIFSCGGLGVYAPARLLDRIDGIIVGRGCLRVDIGQIALLVSSPSILVCRRHLATWRICPCLLPPLHQEVGHFGLPALYEIIFGVIRHGLEGSFGWWHEEHFSLFSVRQKLLIPEVEARDLVFFPSFEVSLDLARGWPLIILELRLEDLPLVRGSSLTALLTLERSSGKIPGVPDDSLALLAGFIYPDHASGDAGWPSHVLSRGVAGVTFLGSSAGWPALPCLIWRASYLVTHICLILRGYWGAELNACPSRAPFGESYFSCRIPWRGANLLEVATVETLLSHGRIGSPPSSLMRTSPTSTVLPELETIARGLLPLRPWRCPHFLGTATQETWDPSPKFSREIPALKMASGFPIKVKVQGEHVSVQSTKHGKIRQHKVLGPSIKHKYKEQARGRTPRLAKAPSNQAELREVGQNSETERKNSNTWARWPCVERRAVGVIVIDIPS